MPHSPASIQFANASVDSSALGTSDAATPGVVFKSLIRDCIGDSLEQFESHMRDVLSSRYDCVQHLVDRASAMSGKRLRPILVFLAAQATRSSANYPSVELKNLIRIATSVELVHMASLVHDDITDHADTRRHQPTVSSTNGPHTALLLGDYLFTKAYATAASCGSTIPARRIAAAATELCEGELRQQMSARNWHLSIREYYSILCQKTASLCTVACRLGAWQVGASQQHQWALQRFGKLLGLAFQIYDDWLDYWGDEQAGKTLGTDLAQLKPTLPLLMFLREDTSDVRQLLLDLTSVSNEQSRHTIANAIRNSTAGEKTLRVAQSFSRRAIQVLDDLPSSPAKTALASIAAFSVNRTA